MESSIYALLLSPNFQWSGQQDCVDLKLRMKKQSAGTLQSKLSHFLFHYRQMSHTTTGV